MTVLTLYRGETKTWTFTVTDYDFPMNLNLATIYFAARKSYPPVSIADDSDAEIVKSTSSGIVITNGLQGEFELTLIHADTKDIADEIIYYGIELIPVDETEPYVVDQDFLLIKPDVVRSI